MVTPYYNRPTQDGLYRHFAAIAEAVDLPLVLYNVPGRTGVNLLPETVVRLADIPGIVGIKEASGSLDQASQIVREAPEAFVVVSGDDSLTLPMMGVGASGVISVVSNIAPEAVSALAVRLSGGRFQDRPRDSSGALRSLPGDVRRDKPGAGEGRGGAAGILLAGGTAAVGAAQRGGAATCRGRAGGVAGDGGRGARGLRVDAQGAGRDVLAPRHVRGASP